jgi:apolipoprotein N-acyltransferase
MIAGLAMYVPHLYFFKSIFGLGAFPLFLIAGFPIAVFLLVLNVTHRRLGAGWALCLTPILWTGIEYFRSEVWYLRFAWVLPGQAAAFLPGVRMLALGVYGVGFLYAVVAALMVSRPMAFRSIGVAGAVILAVLMYVPHRPPSPTDAALHVAGMQLEHPRSFELPLAIDRLATEHPEAQILVLSEYTFTGEPPWAVREVIRKHRRYLVVGGTRVMPNGEFFNTAYVVGPDGQDVFSQAKSVPVQFMTDATPARSRHVWQSPWGKIGIALCYDVSYSWVMDDFVRQGAQGLIIPTMDLQVWGEYERRMLHGRLAPVRAAEYGIPTFGVWSSGVSQLTDRFGTVVAKGGYPGQGDIVAGPLDLGRAGRVPPDRLFAVTMTVITGLVAVYLLLTQIGGRGRKRR